MLKVDFMFENCYDVLAVNLFIYLIEVGLSQTCLLDIVSSGNTYVCFITSIPPNSQRYKHVSACM